MSKSHMPWRAVNDGNGGRFFDVFSANNEYMCLAGNINNTADQNKKIADLIVFCINTFPEMLDRAKAQESIIRKQLDRIKALEATLYRVQSRP